MKYIRTKEGKIFDFEKKFKDHLENVEIEKKTRSRLKFFKQGHYNVFKQADAIEELCDEFVVEDTQGLHYRTYDFKGLENTGNKICGAIWTDKGLIYVAKMNDKGELELL